MRKSLQKQVYFEHKTHQFFAQKQVLEVHTPLLGNYAVSDVYIDSISVTINQGLQTPKTQFLHSSPELAMKVLLAKGSGDIYQICPTFRDNEYGQFNQNEFLLLEWYRLGFSMQQLIAEVLEFLALFLPNSDIYCASYADVFQKFANIDILNCNLTELKNLAKQQQLNSDYAKIADLQMLLFVHLIEPKLSQYDISVITDFPKQQAALSKIKNGVAKRFEVYVKGIEIANGYEELTQAKDYKQCFLADQATRKKLGLADIEIDIEFLANIKDGLPECSGVAIGFSRLQQILSSVGV